MDLLKEIRGEMLDALVMRISDGEDERTHPLALKLLDFAHAKRLCERREALKDVSDMERGH